MQLTFLVVCCHVWSTMCLRAKGQKCLLLQNCSHLNKMHGLENFVNSARAEMQRERTVGRRDNLL